jgi:hypothetical protein
MILTVFLYAVFLLSRANVDEMWFRSNILFLLGVVCGVICICMWTSLILIRTALSYPNSRYHERARSFSSESAFLILHNCVLVSLTAGISFSLLARTLVGYCDESEENIWTSQRCNPMATVFMIPVDQTFACLVTIPIFQLFSRGASGWSIVLGWLVIITASNVALSIANASDYFVWTNAAFFMMLAISYEVSFSL